MWSKAAKSYGSWSRVPCGEPACVTTPLWRSDPVDFEALPGPVLPFGRGRTYSDTCVNPAGAVIDTSALGRFIAFDREHGTLRCEAGVTLGEILALVVPRGWFLPVCPGTKHVTVGGAIAHDVHGKNQVSAGTFGCHVLRFELCRSTGERLVCSPTENSELYRATIGGLGLTGLILWAELRLRPVSGPYFDVRRVRFSGLDEFFDLAVHRAGEHEYGLTWIDTLHPLAPGLRGIFVGGDHAPGPSGGRGGAGAPRLLRLPRGTPALVFNRTTMRLANLVYRAAQLRKVARRTSHYDPFLFPQDTTHPSNRVYGRRGVLAYQCLVPTESARDAIAEMLRRITRPGLQSMMTVLKVFGDRQSPGLLSFSGAGVSLACGFPNDGPRVLRLLDELDAVVRQARGRLYPAKDIRMSRQSFRAGFPRWTEFARHVDPRFSSRFWARVSSRSGADDA